MSNFTTARNGNQSVIQSIDRKGNKEMTTHSVIDDINDLEAQEEKKRKLLQRLLTEELKADNQVFVTKARMDSTVSYVGTQTLRWMAERIKLASQLSLLDDEYDTEGALVSKRNQVDEEGNLVIDAETINQIEQRAPDWSRQTILTHYLVKKGHKFPPILVVVTEPWVDNPIAPEWIGGKATKTSMPFRALDEDGQVGLVDFRKVTAFAIDGQHRLIGVLGLMDLLRQGYVAIKNKAGKEIGRETIDEIITRFKIQKAQIQQLEHESMGFEFIPAVMEGETREEAFVRIRSIFVNVNKTARILTAGEIALMDEDDGFAVIARELMLKQQLLRKEKSGDRVNIKSSALPAGSIWLTNLATLQDMAKDYLGWDDAFKSWTPKSSKEIPLRPEDDEITNGYQKVNELWNQLATLPSFADIIASGQIDKWREFPDAKTPGKGHLLMRPIGQLILAKAIGYLYLAKDGPGLSLQVIFAKLQSFDGQGGFEAADPASPWYGITYEVGRSRMIMGGRNVAISLLEYLISGDTQDKDTEALLQSFRKLRTIKISDEKVLHYNSDGKEVEGPTDITLPSPIS